MAAHQVNITDRAKRYRAQNNVTGPRKCVICGSRSDIQVMHLDGDESHGEPGNLAYGCRSCNGLLAAAFKKAGLGRPTNQYNPAKGAIPTFEQYKWAVSNHERKAHDEGGAVIHATPPDVRVKYARRMLGSALATKRARGQERRADFEDRWNPAPNATTAKHERDIRAYIAEKAAAGKTAEQIYRAVWRRWGYQGQAKDGAVHLKMHAGTEVFRVNPWPFSRPDARRTTPAHGGIAFHQAKAGKRAPAAKPKAKKAAGASSYPDEAALQAGFKRGLTLREMLAANPALRKAQKSNPGLFARLVKRVKANPAAVAAEVFEDFHGFKPAEVVTVSKEVHHHAHLASLGTLVQLDVFGVDERGHKVTGFKGAILACNEARDQLFIEGGDQRMDLKSFGIKQVHEMETLGQVTNIGYKTNKTHLGDEGGEAVYVHRFRATNQNGKHVVVKMTREPDLIYDVRNEQLLFSGGSYEILREGINK
jgi:hypothetical protein